MSEEENIEDQPMDSSPQPTENENTSEPSTINDQPSTNMEVHNHPHHITHKKKWGEYLLEFFMLFLAVFSGLIAENFREQSVENSKEKEFMKSLLIDLQKDKKDLENNISFGPITINYNDSLQVELLKNPIMGNEKRIYHFFLLFQTGIDFIYHDRTVSQLKNTGGFRMIRNQIVSDALADYDIYFRQSITVNNSQYFLDQANTSVKFNCRIFDVARILKYQDSALAHITEINKVEYPNNLKLLTYDNNVIHQMVNNITYNKTNDIDRLTRSQAALKMNNSLDSLVRKEYHLK